jgi:hypothetical protein
MYLLVNLGSRPSRPTTITRRAFAFLLIFFPVTFFHTILKGQKIIRRNATRKAARKARAEPITANPAPGPMYAIASAGRKAMPRRIKDQYKSLFFKKNLNHENWKV